MDKHIRKATEQDRYAIALCIADGFEKDFSVLSKDNRKIASAIATGLQITLYGCRIDIGNIKNKFLIAT